MLIFNTSGISYIRNRSALRGDII